MSVFVLMYRSELWEALRLSPTHVCFVCFVTTLHLRFKYGIELAIDKTLEKKLINPFPHPSSTDIKLVPSFGMQLSFVQSEYE